MSGPSTPEGPRGGRNPHDAGFWAVGRNVLRVSDVPAGAVNLNVEGRRVIGALQGFGQLWQKTYTVRLTGAEISPEEVVALWKREFPTFHPPESRFYPSLDGVAPGEIMLINASVQGMPVYTGVMVLYSDDVSSTVMTAEGLPEAGWNTFSAHEEGGATVVQIQSLARASDPIYEVGFRLFGSTAQERIWTHVLSTLAARFGARAGAPREGLRGPEPAMAPRRERLAQRGPQVRHVHHGSPGTRPERLVSPRWPGLGPRIGA